MYDGYRTDAKNEHVHCWKKTETTNALRQTSALARGKIWRALASVFRDGGKANRCRLLIDYISRCHGTFRRTGSILDCHTQDGERLATVRHVVCRIISECYPQALALGVMNIHYATRKARGETLYMPSARGMRINPTATALRTLSEDAVSTERAQKPMTAQYQITLP